MGGGRRVVGSHKRDSRRLSTTTVAPGGSGRGGGGGKEGWSAKEGWRRGGRGFISSRVWEVCNAILFLIFLMKIGPIFVMTVTCLISICFCFLF